MSIKPVIEVYADPQGFYGGKKGCWRARLKKRPAFHDAGGSVEQAIENLLLNLPNFDRSGEKSNYSIVLIPESNR
jgi:hypothetical protein